MPAHGDTVEAPPTLYLTVGLPGAGKTTMAREIAERENIVRLTPDEWMIPLFGDSDADGMRDVLEGRLIDTARQVLASGRGVVLDFGCWSAEERWAIRAIAEAQGARFEMVVALLDEAERRRRAAHRWATAPETTFAMSEADQDLYLSLFQPTTDAEMRARQVPPCPDGFAHWGEWAASRWPSLPVIPTA